MSNESFPGPFPDSNSSDIEKKNTNDEEAKRRSSATGRVDPFGDESHAEVKYKTLTWWQTSLLMIAETISLGILSLPSVLASVGLVPGIILIVGLGICATYSGFVYGQFKIAYPHVANMADVGEVFFSPIGYGRVGREVFGLMQTIFLVSSVIGYGLEVADTNTSLDIYPGKPSPDLYHCDEHHYRPRHMHCRLERCWSCDLLSPVLAKDAEECLLPLDRGFHLHCWSGLHHRDCCWNRKARVHGPSDSQHHFPARVLQHA